MKAPAVAVASAFDKDLLATDPALRQTVAAVFGADDDPAELVAQRARRLLTGRTVVAWEADPLTFTFTYVSPEARTLLGYPVHWWTAPDFWRRQVVHPEDSDDAISHCAIATAAGMDHDFRYRARTREGAVLHLHDIVHVIKGPLGFAHRLRGLMLPIGPPA